MSLHGGSTFISCLFTFSQDIIAKIVIHKEQLSPWRNGSASDSRSEGFVFESRRGQNFFLVILNDNKHNKTAGFIFKNDPVILLI